MKNHKFKILHYWNQPNSFTKEKVLFFTYNFLPFLKNSFTCQEKHEWLEM